MSLSVANETLLVCDSCVNKNVKDVQMFPNKFWIVCANGATGIFVVEQHPVKSTELQGNKHKWKLAQELLLYFESVCTFLEEKQKHWPRECDLAKRAMGKVSKTQISHEGVRWGLLISMQSEGLAAMLSWDWSSDMEVDGCGRHHICVPWWDQPLLCSSGCTGTCWRSQPIHVCTVARNGQVK